MTFKVSFDERAFKEWNKLDRSIQLQFKKKLKKIQLNPYIESARLSGELAGCYKIKLRASGFRMVYQVIDELIIIRILAIGKRESLAVYQIATKRIN
ncbi:type II toxin-antitoxin system RelE/ParE family toxin [Orbaceae bacterium ac157xtp]